MTQLAADGCFFAAAGAAVLEGGFEGEEEAEGLVAAFAVEVDDVALF